ncbi:hypothetical protein SAMN05216302_101174 [Nitrosomonas aestuarii]|uniref:Uncharacterized protein n=1 Tax=Nitrosomonas aestuarii TaxID=52441 RepID=A0A1I4B723_9PROT|nr:hypothetical protein SAMN05216302_101174 [Nitrosomonas aestuarii]
MASVNKVFTIRRDLLLNQERSLELAQNWKKNKSNLELQDERKQFNY